MAFRRRLILPRGIEPPIQELVIDGVSQVNRQRSFIRLKITQKDLFCHLGVTFELLCPIVIDKRCPEHPMDVDDTELILDAMDRGSAIFPDELAGCTDLVEWRGLMDGFAVRKAEASIDRNNAGLALNKEVALWRPPDHGDLAFGRHTLWLWGCGLPSRRQDNELA